MARSRVSKTVWKGFAPLYAILNSMENLRFYKESYFHILVFYLGYLMKIV